MFGLGFTFISGTHLRTLAVSLLLFWALLWVFSCELSRCFSPGEAVTAASLGMTLLSAWAVVLLAREWPEALQFFVFESDVRAGVNLLISMAPRAVVILTVLCGAAAAVAITAAVVRAIPPEQFTLRAAANIGAVSACVAGCDRLVARWTGAGLFMWALGPLAAGPHAPLCRFLVASWVVILVITCYLIARHSSGAGAPARRALPTILTRKIYHIAALAIFTPPAVLSGHFALGGVASMPLEAPWVADPLDFLCICIVCVFAAMLLLECALATLVRCQPVAAASSGQHPAVPSPVRAALARVDSFMGLCLDARDAGCCRVSHLYLLFGCALPLWVADVLRTLTTGRDATAATVTVPFLGLAMLGVGDAVASAIGRRFGRHKWWAPTTHLTPPLLSALTKVAKTATAWLPGRMPRRMVAFTPPCEPAALSACGSHPAASAPTEPPHTGAGKACRSGDVQPIEDMDASGGALAVEKPPARTVKSVEGTLGAVVATVLFEGAVRAAVACGVYRAGIGWWVTASGADTVRAAAVFVVEAFNSQLDNLYLPLVALALAGGR